MYNIIFWQSNDMIITWYLFINIIQQSHFSPNNLTEWHPLIIHQTTSPHTSLHRTSPNDLTTTRHPQRLIKMPIFCCCFCSKQFNNASGLGNHQWRCVPIENSATFINNDVSLLPTNNNNIEPLSQQHDSNEVNCNIWKIMTIYLCWLRVMMTR